jgi:hypothetical protein
MVRRLLPVLLIPLLLSGCLRYYTGYPKDKLEKEPAKKYALLQYRIKPYPTVLDSGKRGLETALRENSPFREAKQVETMPDKGLYVEAEVKWRQPGVFSLVFVWISAATYTLVPQWSVKEKYTLLFDVYQDGALVKNYKYEVKRKGFMWLPLVLVTWATATTPHQAEVFESMVYQFYEDADPVFAGRAPAPEPAALPPPAPGEWEKVRERGTLAELLAYLSSVELDEAKGKTLALPSARRKELTEHLLDTAGKKGLTWRYELRPDLTVQERRYAVWYLNEFTSYRP